MIKNINVISRNPDNYMRDTIRDVAPVPRNYDPALHPLAAAREYKMAVNAVKLEKVFAKPFVSALPHMDEVTVLGRHPHQLSYLYSATLNGQVLAWNIQKKKCIWKVQAHEDRVYCIESSPDGDSFYTVGSEKCIKKWRFQDVVDGKQEQPEQEWLSKDPVMSLSHHWGRNEFVTCGTRVLLWDATCRAPKTSYNWHEDQPDEQDTLVSVAFNPVERDLFVTSDHANTLILYDTRAKEVKRLKMSMRVNAIRWNPMEAMMLTAASEDFNCYTMDIRRLVTQIRPSDMTTMHEGHGAAVTDISYSPTGREFASASCDKSIRIFPTGHRQSRDVYHTKRMYRVTSVLYSGDARYIFSGSADQNVRVWKAFASEKLSIMTRPEESAMKYSTELKRKFSHLPSVGRIARHRQLPGHLLKKTADIKQMRELEMRREMHRVETGHKSSFNKSHALDDPVVGLEDELQRYGTDLKHRRQQDKQLRGQAFSKRKGQGNSKRGRSEKK